ncbi:Putative protein [Zobellia galactanivorans]|uniref:Uncharacterized protein n=1 Tax=Zobellia galactanivorans (strain DSM 12802 / CCUG 47099 / CIP 106680 / NCIMB 13871 / Dsij) TaxID=63186 RepID=G0L8H9_ZOBGA|nr:Putative protein [Zobellia galactanivorans]
MKAFVGVGRKQIASPITLNFPQKRTPILRGDNRLFFIGHYIFCKRKEKSFRTDEEGAYPPLAGAKGYFL